jgi:energy-coupling factor transport system ATP-binding protein
VALVSKQLWFSYGEASLAAPAAPVLVADLDSTAPAPTTVPVTPAPAPTASTGVLLQNFSAVFERGRITAVTGPNGCGKTTLAKLLVGMLKPSAGQVLLDGESIAPMTLTQIGRHVGLVMQNPERQMFCTSVREEVEFGLRNFGFSDQQIEDRRKRYLEVFDLTRYEECFPFELSGGEKQRVVLAAVLATAPSYLVLDEPTSALDRGRRRVLGELLVTLKAKENVGIVLISHDEAFLQQYADEQIKMAPLVAEVARTS